MPSELTDRFHALPVVRRLTGGGAILHHHELTYSLALAADHPLAADPRALYDLVHVAVVEELQQQGVPAGLRGESHAELGGNFLCFSRGDSFDVVCGGYKILGSAQRRRRGAILQHGSLLWARSEWAAEFPGICDLSVVRVTQAVLEARLRDALVRGLGGGFKERGELTALQLARLAELEQEFGDPC
jgi:lipoate-protein ligase A